MGNAAALLGVHRGVVLLTGFLCIVVNIFNIICAQINGAV